MPTVERPMPPRDQIAEHFRRLILDGTIREGESLPSVRKLATDWNVAHGTARDALAVLRRDGLVVGQPGVGTIVRSRSAQGAGIRASAARKTGRIYPDNQFARITSAELTPAPAEVADALGVGVGASVIRRARTTYVEERGEATPVTMSVSWFDGSLAQRAPLLLESGRIRQGTFGYIEEVTGRTHHEVVEELELSSATDIEADVFGVAIGTPIVRGRNWMLDDQGDVLEFGQSALDPGRVVTYRFEVQQKSPSYKSSHTREERS